MMDQDVSIPLSEDLVLLNLEAHHFQEVIQRMADHLLTHGYVKSTYPQAVLKREQQFPTALPTPIPVSFPHTDVSHCLRPAIAVGVLRHPVKFGFMGDPTQQLDVRVVFMLSVTRPEYQVKTLQKLIDLCQEAENIERILNASVAREVVKVLSALFEPATSTTVEASEETGANSWARREAVIRHPVGLHARPAALFVKTAAKYPCEIQVARADQPDRRVSAKSILSVLGLGIKAGERIIIETRGEQHDAALRALMGLIESNFGEEENASHE
ncbi:HPr family phosphocarrier protein [Thermanaerothrix daxensis]|uniref:HPr family phosphocarrier protein n=1 Tax=Thermanaerothrix daxensis TaxID=869279 RepID=UPI0006C8EAA3|nr:HPr family phosphocarrier protein [Thermanaerothrix daxensis]